MKNKLLYPIVAVAIIAIIIIAYLSMNNTEPISETGYYLDTVCTITIYDMAEDEANEAIDKGFENCSIYEKMLSKTIKGSDVDRINKAKGDFVEVNEDTVDLITTGIKYGKLSDGAFDISVGRLTELWDFHTDEPKLPSEAELSDAVKHIGYEGIEIDGNKVKLKDPEAELDLGGIAKGYIADRVADTLEEMGVKSAVVNLGGNIVAIGKKPSDEDFVIGIERPYSERTEIIGTVNVSDATVVTSGVYERQFELNGKIYHHILDVKTGYPVNSDVEAVSLVSKIGMSVDCDALSTICLLIGSKDAKELIESIDNVEALIVTTDSEYIVTSGMEFKELEE